MNVLCMYTRIEEGDFIGVLIHFHNERIDYRLLVSDNSNNGDIYYAWI